MPADNISFSVGNLVDYTPTWSTVGTAPSLGNGTIQGRYTILGELVFVTAYMLFGSTTTYGTNVFTLTQPVPGLGMFAGSPYGHGFDTSAGEGQVLFAVPNTSTTVAIIGSRVNASAGFQYCQATVPITWANGDSWRVHWIYEVT